MIISRFGAAFIKVQQGDTIFAFNPVSRDFDAKAQKFGADAALVSLNDPQFNGTDNVTFGAKEPFIINGPGEYEIGGNFVRGFGSKGPDGKIYTRVMTRAGKPAWVAPDHLAEATMALPGEMERGDKTVMAYQRGKLAEVPVKDVDYVMPSTQQMFTMQGNLIPAISSTSGGRVYLGAKFVSQALPLRKAAARFTARKWI